MKRPLGATQKWMQEIIIGKGDRQELEKFIKSPNIGAEGGMRIYIHAYRSRLIECMKKEYPVLSHALGEEAFEVFSESYLESHPPSSYTLGRLGERFPQYLKDTRPEGPDSLGNFIIELAALERSFFEVFDAPGGEGETFPADGVADAEGLMEMRVAPVPCLRLLAFRYPVDRYFVEVKKGRDPPIPRAKETWMVMNRRDYVVRFYGVSRTEFEILGALTRGLRVGEAGRKIGPGRMRRHMAEWMDKRFFLDVR